MVCTLVGYIALNLAYTKCVYDTIAYDKFIHTSENVVHTCETKVNHLTKIDHLDYIMRDVKTRARF